MVKNMGIVFMASLRRTPSRCLVLLVGTALAVTSCTTIEPATPTLISIQGHGKEYSLANQSRIAGQNDAFYFDAPVVDPATNQLTHYTESRVCISVPYPTSIELAIDGKPLTKVEPSLLSRNYEYAGTIENPGENPAKWSLSIKTPFDVSPNITSPNPRYRLTIVNVSGSKRSQPLTIDYFESQLGPLPGVIPPPPRSCMSNP